MNLSARDKILLTAHDLFYRDGIRVTGVDKIITEAGVTKVTFYRHFPSKNDLVLAFLEYRHGLWIKWFKESLQRHGAYSGRGVTAIVPALAEWFQNPIFRGCAFINSVVEVGGNSDEVMRISREHKRDMTAVIAELLPESGNQWSLANALALAVDGAIFKAQLEVMSEVESKALDGLSTIIQALGYIQNESSE